ncbi:hypothetical protein AG1IA_05639 [Rhizoctonia solani AG-1 IA]|uniref:Uncharacterized protein n=1 Tax=Thanatephorus cucumeris (strain AG1-IA) TaxID=983506 RepID=L8WUB1_THACA|nr:hypothetical protein AG1IA_05639 [Rhizoctonia solani AG-1 IA]
MCGLGEIEIGVQWVDRNRGKWLIWTKRSLLSLRVSKGRECLELQEGIGIRTWREVVCQRRCTRSLWRWSMLCLAPSDPRGDCITPRRSHSNRQGGEVPVLVQSVRAHHTLLCTRPRHTRRADQVALAIQLVHPSAGRQQPSQLTQIERDAQQSGLCPSLNSSNAAGRFRRCGSFPPFGPVCPHQLFPLPA